MEFFASNISSYSKIWIANFTWSLENVSANVGSWSQAGLLPALLAIVSFLWLQRRSRSQLHLPPGPRPLPVIGNLHQLSSDVHRDFENLGKKYGPIMYVKIGAVPVVVVQNCAIASEILRTHDKVFANRPQDTTVRRRLASGVYNLGFAPVGPHWRYLKKVLASELLSPHILLTFKEQRQEEEIDTMIAMMERSKQGGVIDFRGQMSVLMHNVVARMVVGKKIDGSAFGDKGNQDAFRIFMVGYFSLFDKFYIPDWFPYTRVLGDFQGTEKRMGQFEMRMEIFLQDCIDEHRSQKEARQGHQVKDVIDLLMEVPDLEGEKEFGNDDMKNLLKGLLIAGNESAATVLTWALAELMHNPEVMKRAQDEMDSVVGRERLVREEDLHQLKFLRAIVKETFRLHSTQFLLPRQPSENTKVAGYDIPSNTQVFVSIWAIQRDPALWERPLEFIPDRFLDNSQLDYRGSSHQYMPFGSGQRRCPGSNYGLVMIQSSLAHLVHLCNYSLLGGLKPEDMDMREYGSDGQKKVPLEVIATPRLAPSFYATHLGYKC